MNPAAPTFVPIKDQNSKNIVTINTKNLKNRLAKKTPLKVSRPPGSIIQNNQITKMNSGVSLPVQPIPRTRFAQNMNDTLSPPGQLFPQNTNPPSIRPPRFARNVSSFPGQPSFPQNGNPRSSIRPPTNNQTIPSPNINYSPSEPLFINQSFTRNENDSSSKFHPYDQQRIPNIFGTFSIYLDPTHNRFIRLDQYSIGTCGSLPRFSRSAPSIAEAMRLLNRDIEYWIAHSHP